MASPRATLLKLGLFVLSGTAVLLVGLYLLGSKRDMFSRTMMISARFREVNGLRTGNNVRYAGIDVGSVKRITIISDTLVEVQLTIRQEAAEHMRTNSIARVASDGLMGNKLISIEPGAGTGDPINDGDLLSTAEGLDTDAMLRSLSRSNDNVVAITSGLKELIDRLNSDVGLVSILSDSGLVRDIRGAVHDVRLAAVNARALTQHLNDVADQVQHGKGALGVLTADARAEEQARDLLLHLQAASDSLEQVSGNLARYSAGLDREGGLSHAMTNDTALVASIKRVLSNLDSSSVTLNEDLKALQRNWFFRRYFREKDKSKH